MSPRLGWLGAVAYALPILEVWLLNRMSADGADAFLVVLQVVWVAALVWVLARIIGGYRAARARPPEAADEAADSPDPHRAARMRPRPARERRRSHR